STSAEGVLTGPARAPASRVWNQGRFDALAGPSEFQGLRKLRKRKLFGDDFVDLHPAALQVSDRPRKTVNLREGTFDADFSAKEVEGVNPGKRLFRVNAVNQQR